MLQKFEQNHKDNKDLAKDRKVTLLPPLSKHDKKKYIHKIDF